MLFLYLLKALLIASLRPNVPFAAILELFGAAMLKFAILIAFWPAIVVGEIVVVLNEDVDDVDDVEEEVDELIEEVDEVLIELIVVEVDEVLIEVWIVELEVDVEVVVVEVNCPIALFEITFVKDICTVLPAYAFALYGLGTNM